MYIILVKAAEAEKGFFNKNLSRSTVVDLVAVSDDPNNLKLLACVSSR